MHADDTKRLLLIKRESPGKLKMDFRTRKKKYVEIDLLILLMVCCCFCPALAQDCSVGQTRLFLLSNGRDSSGCGSRSNRPCRTLQYLKTHHPTWFRNTVLHIDSSITFEGDDCVWASNQSFACFKLANYRVATGIRATFSGCQVAKMTLQLQTLQLQVQNCSFENSRVVTESGGSVLITNTRWRDNARNVLTVGGATSVILKNSSFTEGSIGATWQNLISVTGAAELTFDQVSVYNIDDSSANALNTIPFPNRVIYVRNVETFTVYDTVVSGSKNAVALYARDVKSISITYSRFENNVIDIEGRAETYFEAGALYLKSDNIHIGLSEFSGNTGFRGGAVGVYPLTPFSGGGKCAVTGENVTFVNNTARMGGALYVALDCELDLRNATFIYNEGFEFGGAIYTRTPTNSEASGGIKKTHSIVDSRFDQNWAGFAGGSIFVGCIDSEPVPQQPDCFNAYTNLIIEGVTLSRSNNLTEAVNMSSFIYGGAVASYVDTQLSNCNFDNNVGYLGGAIFFYGTIISMSYIRFFDNTAYFSGKTVYAEYSMLNLSDISVVDILRTDYSVSRSLIGSRYQMAFYSTILTFTNVLVTLTLDEVEPVEISLFDYESDFPHPNSPFGNPQFNLGDSTFTCPINYRPLLRLIEGLDAVCGSGQNVYADTQGSCGFTRSFSMSCQRSDSNRYIAGAGKFVVGDGGENWIQPNGTEIVQSSGLSLSRTLRSVDNGTLPDIPNYRLEFTTSYDCPVPGGHCVGQLRALPGYWGSFKSQTSEEVEFFSCPPARCCTNNENCLTYDSCNRHRTGVMCSECEEGYTEGLLSNGCFSKNHCSLAWVISLAIFFGLLFLIISGAKFELAEVLKKCCGGSDGSDDKGGLFTGSFFILLYLYQDMGRFHMNLYHCSAHGRWDFLFGLAYGDSEGSWASQVCVDNLFGGPVNWVSKTMLKFMLIYVAYVWLLILWASFSCLPGDSRKKHLTTLGNVFIVCTLFFYQTTATYAITFLDCVHIQDSSFLRVDTGIECYSLTRDFSIVFLTFVSVPMPFYVLFAPNLLKKGKISTAVFILGFIVPLIGLLLILIQVGCGEIKEGSIGEELAKSKHLKNNFKDDNKFFKNISWLGIDLGLRLVLVGLSIGLNAVVVRASLMLVLSFIRLGLQIGVRPYKFLILNVASIISLSFIMVVSVCTLGLAALENCELENCSTDSTVNALAIITDVFSLYIPPVVFLFYVIFKLVKLGCNRC